MGRVLCHLERDAVARGGPLRPGEQDELLVGGALDGLRGEAAGDAVDPRGIGGLDVQGTPCEERRVILVGHEGAEGGAVADAKCAEEGSELATCGRGRQQPFAVERVGAEPICLVCHARRPPDSRQPRLPAVYWDDSQRPARGRDKQNGHRQAHPWPNETRRKNQPATGGRAPVAGSIPETTIRLRAGCGCRRGARVPSRQDTADRDGEGPALRSGWHDHWRPLPPRCNGLLRSKGTVPCRGVTGKQRRSGCVALAVAALAC
jgi:hypothetical protein